jgi:hypothetical protein
MGPILHARCGPVRSLRMATEQSGTAPAPERARALAGHGQLLRRRRPRRLLWRPGRQLLLRRAARRC